MSSENSNYLDNISTKSTSDNSVLAARDAKEAQTTTTQTINIGACLAAEKNKKVLLVDLDHAGFLTIASNAQGGSYIADVIREGRKLTEEDFAKTTTPNLLVLKNRPNEINDKFFQSTKSDGSVVDNINVLRRMFSEVDADFILFDCPQYYELSTLNILYFVDYMLCPLEISPKSLNTLKRILKVHEQTGKVNPKLKMLGFFAIRVDMRKRRFKKTIPVLKKELGERFFNSIISQNEEVVNSQGKSQTVYEYEDMKAMQEFSHLTNEILVKTQ